MGKITKENLFNQKGADYYKNILFFLEMYKDRKLELKHLRYILVKCDKKLLPKKLKQNINDYLDAEFEDIISNDLFLRAYEVKWICFKEQKDKNGNVEGVAFDKEIDSANLLTFYLNQLMKLELIYKVYYDGNIEHPGYAITEDGEDLLYNALSHFILDKMYTGNEAKKGLMRLLSGKLASKSYK